MAHSLLADHSTCGCFLRFAGADEPRGEMALGVAAHVVGVQIALATGVTPPRSEHTAERVADHVRELALLPGGDRRVALRAGDIGGRSRLRQASVVGLLAKLRGLLIERAVPEPWAPAPDPDAESEARVQAIRQLSIDEQQQLSEAIQEAERLVALGFARASATEPSPDGKRE